MRSLFLLAGVLIAGGSAAPAAENEGGAVETVVNPWVTTDKYVDTSSLEGIVAGIAREGMTDEGKVLAFYHWYRRMLFHHRFMGGDRRDVLKVLNSYGCNLCGSQAAVFVVMLQKAGFKTRVCAAKGGEGFGTHTFVQIFYDGKWHCFDTMTSFCVYNRADPPRIASLDELKADPTIVTMAVEEKRAPPGFVYCEGHQENTVKDIPKLKASMGSRDFRWSTCIFEGGTFTEFWAKAAKKGWTLTEGGTYNGRYTPGVTDFTLKPNEELVRLWDHISGKYVKKASHPDFGPHHTCGAADEHDPMHFKFYEPYLKENLGHTKKCYRYFGNGWLEWKPKTGAEVAAACKLRSLAREDVLFKVAGASGTLTIPVKVPYAGVEIELDLLLKQEGEGSVTRVYLVKRVGRNRKARRTEVAKIEGKFDGAKKIVVPHTDAGLFEYELAIEGKRADGGSVIFAPVRLRTIFQENIYALPGFFPGKNTVTVRAAKAQEIKQHALAVTYEWAEGEGWATPKSVTKKFETLPASFEVEVAGPKMPRMKKLVVRLEPKP